MMIKEVITNMCAHVTQAKCNTCNKNLYVYDTLLTKWLYYMVVPHEKQVIYNNFYNNN